MSELDDVLINFFKNQSSDVSVKDKIPLTKNLKIKKVAFDMYKVMGDQYDDLWKVEEIDGSNFLIRSSDPKYQTKEGGDWSASSNYDYNHVTLSYKNVPICGFSSDEYGFSGDDIFTFKSALLEVVSSDKEFIKKVVASQPSAKAEVIKNLFPEILKSN
ncbi:hypothetical protein CMI47_09065 [Candidatus Pacearchaeota archaeon]|nr:hypothetical protein [Candidatus Pacearchaeota archaeon]|tara:strand:+ start:3188 stop:3664 length:477 start_codon:yes stop_codon:yes gene_type:complete